MVECAVQGSHKLLLDVVRLVGKWELGSAILHAREPTWKTTKGLTVHEIFQLRCGHHEMSTWLLISTEQHTVCLDWLVSATSHDL